VRICFTYRPEGNEDIYVIGSERGVPQRLTSDPANDWVPSWSGDGKWIYFSSNRSREIQIWKIPAEGGDPSQLTTNGGLFPVESPDGESLFYWRQKSLWKVPLEGGKESLVLPLVQSWWVVEKGVYFVPRLGSLEFFPFNTGEAIPVLSVPPESVQGFLPSSISPDGRWMLGSKLPPAESDLMLVEDFR
jgi:hypothetical protein